MNRYQQLAASGAVAEQTLTNQQATVDSNRSSYDDANALLQKAQENLDDTIIRAPISGKLSVDDVRDILEKGDRKKAGKTLSAKGLHLIKVVY